MSYFTNHIKENYVGVIPAAGSAHRMQPLPFSKELIPFPAGFPVNESGSPLPLSSWLLSAMQLAGVQQVHMIIREGKWDIPAYYGSGAGFGLDFSYHVVGPNQGSPYSIDKAYNFLKSKNVVFGFPDIIFYPKDALLQLVTAFEKTNADVMLGLFDVDSKEKWDVVLCDKEMNVREVFIKRKDAPEKSKAWIMAVWSSRFSALMHQLLHDESEQNPALQGINSRKELYIGSIVQSAIEKGLIVKGFYMENGKCLDAGTPKGYSELINFNK